MRISRTAVIAAPLVFTSGLCALVYQIVWTRELRFVFGASTAAAAAVVAIFIAGLGAGGLVLGRRVEQSVSPLRFYAHLELAIAGASALTPVLLWLARAAYIALGGSLSLGLGGATLVRLILAWLVLGVPTFLMGGTLPAIARAVETEADGERRGVAIAYGMNTLGAVLGCLLANFVLLEALGAKRALFCACALNALVAMTARAIARGLPEVALDATQPERSASGASTDADAPDLAPRLVLVSAAVVGFAFFLMELVWYRLLGPLLGGTVFAFGLILAVALTGIGIGSALYTVLPLRARAASFALTCLIEAALLAFPYALGDRVALFALMLRPLGGLGFGGLIFGWLLVCGLVVFPAALVSGVQFPLLIALLGRGREQVGRQVGQAYAANTLGAIAGALAGGFGLLPALGALGCYKLAAGLLLGWGALIAALAAHERMSGSVVPLTAAAVIIAGSVAMLGAEGPTAAFRHSPIGAGRVDASSIDSANGVQAFLRRERQGIVWQAEGVESVVALEGTSGLAFVVNGKIDGNARADAATQVMLGTVGAALLPKVKNALVVGLGTGSSAGWLAKLPGIERVDVAEIEPAILEVAKRCASVNEDVLQNPKVHVFRGDARELLAVSRTQYDLIVSEPSNPYRAGIASLYTKDFYERVTLRLAPHGLFVQWVQSYEIDAGTVRTIYATLDSVFPSVETYRGMPRDLFLIGSRDEPVLDVAAMRERLSHAPFDAALRVAWRTQGLEGFLGHFVAQGAFAHTVAQHHEGGLSTDDLSPIEFAFGRFLGRELTFSVTAVLKAARALAANRPAVNGYVDWARVDLERELFAQTHGQKGDPRSLADVDRARLAVMSAWTEGKLDDALAQWSRLPAEVRAAPLTTERSAWTELLAQAGSDEAPAWLSALAREQPTEAAALKAQWHMRRGQKSEALAAFADAFSRYRSDPWPDMELMSRALRAAQALGSADHALAPQLDTMLAKPFSVHVNQMRRIETRLQLALALGPDQPLCVSAFAELEPNIAWALPTLSFRAACYAAHDHPLRTIADTELRDFAAKSPPTFSDLTP